MDGKNSKKQSALRAVIPSVRCIIIVLAFFYLIVPLSASCHEKKDLHYIDTSKILTFENGFQALLIPSPSTQLVSCLVLVKTGSAAEPIGKYGLAHLLEHLIFGGTKTRTQRQIFQKVHAIGGYLNGFSTEDYIGYIIMVHRDHFKEALDIQSDILFNTVIDADKLKKEKKIVIEEIRQNRINPDFDAEAIFIKHLLQNTPYGHGVIGTEHSVTSIALPDILNFYRQFYIPNNMIAVITGGFDPEEIGPCIEKYFGKYNPQNIQPASKGVTPSLHEQMVYVYKGDFAKKSARIGFICPDASDPVLPSLKALAYLFSNEQLQVKEWMKAHGIVVDSISSQLNIYRTFTTLSFRLTFPSAEDEKDIVETFVYFLRHVTKDRIKDAVVKKAMTGLATEETLLSEKIHYYAMFKAPLLVATSPDFLLSHEDGFQKFTAGDVKDVWKNVIEHRPFVALLAVPKGAQHRESSHQAPSDRIKRIELKNGLKAVIETRVGSPIFAIHVLAKNRLFLEPESKEGITEVMQRLLLKGSKNWDEREIQERLNKTGAVLEVAPDYDVPFGDFYASPRYSYIRMEVLSQHAENALQILSEIIAHPLFEPISVKEADREVADIAEMKKKEPGFIASEALRKHIFSSHPYGKPFFGNSENIKEITRQDLRIFHSKYFSSENLIISVVSGLPGQKVARLLEKYFTSIKPSIVNLKTLSPIKPPEESITVKVTSAGEQASVYIGTVFKLRDIKERYALDIAVSVLSARLFRTIREKQGYAYSPGASVSCFGKFAYLVISAHTSPEKAMMVKKALESELRAFYQSNISSEEVKRRVNAICGRYQMRMLSSINRAYYLGIAEMEGLEHAFGERYRKHLEGVTAREVKRVVENMIAQAKYVTVVVNEKSTR